jgi:hypothetical protein
MNGRLMLSMTFERGSQRLGLYLLATGLTTTLYVQQAQR